MLVSTSLLHGQTSAVAQTMGPEKTFLWLYEAAREQRSAEAGSAPGRHQQ